MIMGITIATVLYNTLVPWDVGMMLISPPCIGLRKTWRAAGSVLFSVCKAPVPLMWLYAMRVTAMSCDMLDLMVPSSIAGYRTSFQTYVSVFVGS
jgi:hypothetical protein